MTSQQNIKVLEDLSEQWNRSPLRPDGKNHFDDQTFARKVFWCVWELYEGVECDGLGLYFYNEADSAKFATTALTEIGAFRTLNIVNRAAEMVFPEGFPETEDEMRGHVELAYLFENSAASQALREGLNELYEPFDAASLELVGLLYDFVLKHPKEFGVTPPAPN